MHRPCPAPVLLALVLAGSAAAEPSFEDASAALPVPHVYDGGWEHFVGGGVAAFDCDGDRFPDLFVAGGDGPARLFRNRSVPGSIAFENASVPWIEGVTGAWPLDIDGDGMLDLAVLRVGSDMLLRGTGDCAFEDASVAWGFDGGDAWSTAFSATWEPGADRPTLAIGHYVDRDDPGGPFRACDDNVLHRPRPGGGWTAIPLAPGYCALSMLFSDPVRTGRATLRVSNDRHYYVSGGAEQMWALDPLRLLNESDGWPRLSIWGMGIASRDITGDGVPDVALTSMGDQILQLSGPDGWTDAPFAMGAAAQRPHTGGDGRPSTGWHAAFGDVDNDGRDDLFISKGNVDQMPDMAARDPDNLLIRLADGTFREAASEAGVAGTDRGRGAALIDLDLDGRLDLAVVNRRAPMRVHRNVTPDAGGSVQVALDVAGPNRQGVGAWIEIRRPDGQVAAREVTVGGGHAGGQAGYHHFGLGSAHGAEVRATLPGGDPTPWMSGLPGGRYTLSVDPAGTASLGRDDPG